ncbi:hypothetical protein FIBSPDRAFT_274669 [Athelia psychrophila]|uniref:Uncharacterized protein n=1 Tax=Athelia psychrophila TaxID=1759441 RepID=A0A166RB72_9AGAM|nr:hypothetical protein FIBSPDRAFT_274669 [Fibularhizoctonia sp. CBS 109695]
MWHIRCYSLWREIAARLEPDARAAQPLSHDHTGRPGFTFRANACPLVQTLFDSEVYTLQCEPFETMALAAQG